MGFMGSRFVAKRMFIYYIDISQHIVSNTFFYLPRWSWDVVKQFRQISPAAMAGTGGRTAPFSFTVSLVAGKSCGT